MTHANLPPASRRKRKADGRKKAQFAHVVTLDDQRRIAEKRTQDLHPATGSPDLAVCAGSRAVGKPPSNGQRRILELGRNRDGEYYVRESVHSASGADVVTWHFDEIGEMYLSLCKVRVGERIPDRLFAFMKTRGLLVTLGKRVPTR